LIQSDGKILVGGAARECGNRNCPVNTALARYNTDGSLDATFGNGGMVDVAAIGGATTLGLDAAGDIFVLNNSLAAEFSSTGVLLPAITPAPLTVVSDGGLNAFQPDGNYLVPEGVFDNGNDEDVDAQMVRFLATGAVDASFNSPVFDFAPQAGVAGDDVQATTLQSNGQIVVGGLHSGNGGQIFGMARFNAGGTLDTTFGIGGTLTTSFGPNSAQVFAVLVQADGKIVAVGQTSNNQGITSIAMARYLGQ
jgi:uncharacterized delta-60 repeat protein